MSVETVEYFASQMTSYDLVMNLNNTVSNDTGLNVL